MAFVDPWDGVLEQATTLLVAMTGGHRSGRVRIRDDAGRTIELHASTRSVSVQIAAADLQQSPLDDYRLVVIYGCSFHPIGNPGRPLGFGKTLQVRDGFHWDEQSLREVVLEALGLLRHILGSAATELELEDLTRAPVASIARGRIPRRKR